ncbi:arylesterase [Tritonibacter horizontis]|uniref:Esterase TesA n=1 Tax=Tritonibacter horizontis TaxID=1768241 RepID=A0A132BSA4_9RHOB|nr:arylesterase [Tritonibacter horizontis]KUP90630.1 esterase TesA precursor [Tritonibacter horizontis]
MHKFLKKIAATLVVFTVSGAMTAAEPVRLAAFGDSLVQGYGLPQDQGFVPQLEAWLEAQGGDVDILNAGVSGDTTAGGAARIDWTLAEAPDGVIVLLGGNDVLRGLPPAAARRHLTQIVDAAQAAGAQVMLIGMEAPLNFGPEYKAEFDQIYPALVASHGVLLHPYAFEGIVKAAGQDPAAFGTYLQPDGIHPNALGVAANIDALGPVVLDLLDRIAARDAGQNETREDG